MRIVAKLIKTDEGYSHVAKSTTLAELMIDFAVGNDEMVARAALENLISFMEEMEVEDHQFYLSKVGPKVKMLTLPVI